MMLRLIVAILLLICLWQEFDPSTVGLPADFYLLSYSRLKG
jgi:hypothetical protein